MEKNKNIEPFCLIHDILMNWWVILLGAISVALLTYVMVNVRYVPKYSTSATFAVSARKDSNAASNLGSASQMAATLEKILQSNVMGKVINEKLDIKLQGDEITAQVIEGTNLLTLTVTAGSPKDAIDLMHTIMENYSSVSYYTVGNAVMNVLEEPKIPFSPNNPLDVRTNVKKAFRLSLLGFIALFGILSYMKDTVKREEEIEEKLDARSLGIIAYAQKYKTLKELWKHKKKALLINEALTEFSFVEGYKKLATKISYQMAKIDGKVLVVTSVSENEGKSTVAANIAIALAEQSKRVLLIEGDLRRPSQFLVFGKDVKEENEIGEYLRGNIEIKNTLLTSDVPNLYLMIGRNCYSSSTEILQSDRLKKVFDFGRKAMDYVIIDSPPAGLMGDAEVLADSADAVMVVVKQNYMMAEDINDVLDSFREHHSKVLGVVLNGVRSIHTMPLNHYYGRYGRYGKYGDYNKNKGNE